MRKIVKVIPRKIVTQYECGICKEKYRSVKSATQCEKRNLEKKRFAVGDRVRSLELRECAKFGKGYYAIGNVIAIQGPRPSNFDYEVRHLGGHATRLNAHIFAYIIEFACPHCDKIRQESYYAPELIKLPKSSKKRKGEGEYA